MTERERGREGERGRERERERERNTCNIAWHKTNHVYAFLHSE